MLLSDWLSRAAELNPERDAVVDVRTRCSYGALADAAARIARLLFDSGVRRGDRVVLAFDNSYLWVAAFFGALRAGAVVVPLPPGFKNDRLVYALHDCTPVAGILDAATASAVPEAWRRTARIFVVPGGHAGTRAGEADLLRAMQQVTPRAPASRCVETDLAAIIYTSGSTGAPRGVMLSHLNLRSNAESIVAYLRLNPSDRIMAVLPFHYVYGLSLLTTHVSVGASLAIDNRFAFPNAILKSMQQFEVTGFAGVPSTFALLLHRSSIARLSFPALRYVTQAGGPMPPALLQRWRSVMPDVPFYVMYGATEASARLAYLDPAELHARPGSIGKAIPNVELTVLGDDGRPVAPGDVGEIVARGPNIMIGYWNSPEETRIALGPSGFRTGDLATCDADGFLYIVGRRQDMLKVGGQRVGAKEIEDVLHGHPAIHEAAVVGAPHELLGEVPVAVVSLQAGAEAHPEEIRRFCGTSLPDHKVPARVFIEAELPKNPAGKIDKPQLRRLCSELAAIS